MKVSFPSLPYYLWVNCYNSSVDVWVGFGIKALIKRVIVKAVVVLCCPLYSLNAVIKAKNSQNLLTKKISNRRGFFETFAKKTTSSYSGHLISCLIPWLATRTTNLMINIWYSITWYTYLDELSANIILYIHQMKPQSVFPPVLLSSLPPFLPPSLPPSLCDSVSYC